MAVFSLVFQFLFTVGGTVVAAALDLLKPLESSPPRLGRFLLVRMAGTVHLEQTVSEFDLIFEIAQARQGRRTATNAYLKQVFRSIPALYFRRLLSEVDRFDLDAEINNVFSLMQLRQWRSYEGLLTYLLVIVLSVPCCAMAAMLLLNNSLIALRVSLIMLAFLLIVWLIAASIKLLIDLRAFGKHATAIAKRARDLFVETGTS
jgi:hypothetical protein